MGEGGLSRSLTPSAGFSKYSRTIAMSTEKKKALGITPGEAKIIDGDFVYILNENGSNRVHFKISKGWALEWSSQWMSGGLRTTQEEANANAALYAEAHNVANETGMAPRELLDKLREAERWIASYLQDHGWPSSPEANAKMREFMQSISTLTLLTDGK